MAQFDVHYNTNAETAEAVPFLLNIQADLLDSLMTRVVIPLYRQSAFPKPARDLNPVFEINGGHIVLVTQELAGVPCQILGEKVASLAKHRVSIIAAIDFLMSGI